MIVMSKRKQRLEPEENLVHGDDLVNFDPASIAAAVKAPQWIVRALKNRKYSAQCTVEDEEEHRHQIDLGKIKRIDTLSNGRYKIYFAGGAAFIATGAAIFAAFKYLRYREKKRQGCIDEVEED